MKAIVFVGSNKSGSSYEALKASENMKYYTVLLTDRSNFMEKRADFPHVHLMMLCNLGDINAVRDSIEQLIEERFEIHAIVSFIDPYCQTAAVLSREYGLTRFSEEAIEVMLDKIKSRELLKQTPYSPFYQITNGRAASPPGEMPLVLKSPVSSASKDVHMARTHRQYDKAFSLLRRRYPNTPVLTEEFIDGTQYLAETLTVNGRVHVAAVIEQEITFTGRFIVTGYKMITEPCRLLEEAAESIIHAHGMKNGPCHLELRLSDGEWKLIEANPRIAGGAINLFIETAWGVNMAKETLKLALGQKPDLSRKREKETFLQYVVVPREGILTKVTGKNAALNSPGVEHVYVKPKKGSALIPPISMGHRYAYVIASGANAAEAEENAKTAASEIKFHLREAAPSELGLTGFERGTLHELKKENSRELSLFAQNITFE